MSDRPRSVAWCERLAFVALLMRIATAYWGDGQWRIAMVDAQTSPGVGLTALAIGICAPTALALWATRGASRAAVWFLSIWVALLTVGFGVSIVLGQTRLTPISSASFVILLLHIGAVMLLFSRGARRWLRNERTADEIATEFS